MQQLGAFSVKMRTSIGFTGILEPELFALILPAVGIVATGVPCNIRGLSGFGR